MIIEMETAGNGVRYRSRTVQADGRETLTQYTAEYNGRETLVMGASGLLAPVSLERIDERTVVASYKRGMQVIATSCRTVSKNGKVMTIVTLSTDRDGKA